MLADSSVCVGDDSKQDRDTLHCLCCEQHFNRERQTHIVLMCLLGFLFALHQN